MTTELLPADVRRLVIAAREVVYGLAGEMATLHDDEACRDMRKLDAACEAFAERVPWENRP